MIIVIFNKVIFCYLTQSKEIHHWSQGLKDFHLTIWLI